MDIMRANASDIDGLVKIRLAYLNEDINNMTGEQTDQLIHMLPDYYKKHLENDFIAYVAKDKGEIIASVFLVILEKPANPNFITGRIGNILNVYTKPDYRRLGLASRLMESAIQDAKELGLSYLELMATEDGYPLYKKIGFTEAVSNCTSMKLSLS